MKIFESIYRLSNDPDKGPLSVKKLKDLEGNNMTMGKVGHFFKNAMMDCFPEKFAKEWKIEDIHLRNSTPYIKIPKPLFDDLRDFLGRQKEWAVSTVYYRNSEARQYYRVSYLGDLEFSSIPGNYGPEKEDESDDTETLNEARTLKILDVAPNAKWTIEIASTGAKKVPMANATAVYEGAIAHLFNNQGFNAHRATEIGESPENLLNYFLTGINFPTIYKYFAGIYVKSEFNSESIIESVFEKYYTTIRNSFELLLGNGIAYSRKGSDKLAFLLERGGSQYEIVHADVKTISAGESTFHTDEIANMFTGSTSAHSLINDDTFPADIVCYRKSEAAKIKKAFGEAKTKEELISLFDKFFYGGDDIKPHSLIGISLKKVEKINTGNVELITISNREDSDVIVDHKQIQRIKIVPCSKSNIKSTSTSYVYYEFEKGKDNKYFSRPGLEPVIFTRTNQGDKKDITAGWVMEASIKGADAQLGKGSLAFVRAVTGRPGKFVDEIVRQPVPMSFEEFKHAVQTTGIIYVDDKYANEIDNDFSSLNTKNLSTKKDISNNIIAWMVYGGISQEALSTQELKMFTKMSEGEQIKYMFAKYLAYCAHCPLYDGKRLVDAVSGTYLKIC